MQEFVKEAYLELTGDDPLELAPGFGILTSGTIYFEVPFVGRAAIGVIYDPVLQRLTANEVSISAPVGSEVTGTALRSLRIHEAVQNMLHEMVYYRADDGTWENDPNLVSLTAGERDLIATDKAKRDEVARRIYLIAKLLDRPPLKMISDELGISQSTATRIIARARADGHLVNHG